MSTRIRALAVAISIALLASAVPTAANSLPTGAQAGIAGTNSLPPDAKAAPTGTNSLPIRTSTLPIRTSAFPPVSRPVAVGTSLPVIERQVMCVTCKIPLNVAESPQADRERALIRRLIAEGKSEAQVKNALVEQYGAAVLGLPASKGFDLTVYLVPAAVLLALLLALVLLLPSWRRHARAQADPAPSTPVLSEGDAARLDADLERFG